jgi:flavin-dependent dehydrogenase
MTDAWDAVVIGAGPAGAVTARELARRGNRVLLVDRARFPRSKVCGCCLNGNAIASLKRLGLSHAIDDGVRLNSMMLAAGGSNANLKLNGGIALGRDVLDQRLVDEACAAGATFRDGVAAKVDGAVVKIGDEPVETRIVIQATGLAGSESQVSPGSRIGGGALVQNAPAFYEPGRLFMAAGRGGYVGLVRLTDDSLDVAAAFDAEFVRTAGGLERAANAILARTGWPEVHADQPWKGTPALTRHRGSVAEHRLFAVGDATGYVEPFTGEGMAWAVSSAAALAPIAHRAVREWNDECVAEWRRAHAAIVGRRQWLCRAAARVLRSPRLTGFALRALAFAPALARPVVAALDRPSDPGSAGVSPASRSDPASPTDSGRFADIGSSGSLAAGTAADPG